MTEAPASILAVDDDRINRMLLSRELERQVIMVSALEDIETVVRCIEAGAADYLPKPFDPVLLRARINGCLTKKRLHDHEVEYIKQVGDVVEAATAVEDASFVPDSLDHVATPSRRPVAPAVSDVRLEYPEGERRVWAARGAVPAFRSLRRATFEVRPDERAPAVVGELKVWVHRVSADHDSEAIASRLEVRVGHETRRFALELSRGQIALPLTEPSWTADIALAGGTAEGSTPGAVTDDSLRGGTD